MFYVFPNVQLNCYAHHLMLFRHRPHPTDPERCLFRPVDPRPAGTGGRLNEHRTLVRGQDSMGPVTDADLDAVERLQVGMRSSGFSDPLLGRQESCIGHMHATLGDWVQGP